MNILLKITLIFWLCIFRFATPAMASCNPYLEETTPTVDFIINADTTVTHLKTGLVWDRCALGQVWDPVQSLCTGVSSLFLWSDALKQATIANAANYLGSVDWRLPNVKELQSLVENKCSFPAINVTVFPQAPDDFFWSATTDPSFPNLAWMVSFSQGLVQSLDKSNIFPPLQVRLVRGGQLMDGYDLFASATGATLTVNPNSPGIFGSPVTLTANLTGGGNYRGTIKFKQNGVELPACSAQPVSNGSASCVVNGLAVGSYIFVAEYSGDLVLNGGTHNPSVTAPLSYTINKANQSLNVTANPNPGVVGGTSTLSASGGPSGNAITFASTTPAICNVNGNIVNFIAVGTCTINANQAGNNNYNAASQTISIKVAYRLSYVAGVHGSITGNTEQNIDPGANGSTVTAVPNAHAHFVGWSDGLMTPSRTDSNINANLTVTANFAMDTYTLNYTAGPNGSLSGVAVQTVDYGTSGSAVTVVPASNYHFVNWSDGVTTVTRVDSNVTANLNVTANFESDGFMLNYSAGANGTLTGISSQKVSYGANGSEVTAVPAAHYHFVNWSDGLATATRTDMNVTANLSVVAYFAADSFVLTYGAGANGVLTGSTFQTVNYGASGSAVTAVPAAHYHFLNWNDGVVTPIRTDSNIAANLTVIANFELDFFKLNYSAGSNGSLSGTAAQTVNFGVNGTLVTTIPNNHYHFVSWSDGLTNASRMDTNIAANVNVTAIFELDSYQLNYLAGENGTLMGTTTQTVNHGDKGTEILAVANPGYEFVVWSDGVYTPSRVDANVSGSLTVTAKFAPIITYLPEVSNTYLMQYFADRNGRIAGQAEQVVNAGANATQVTAEPNSGYQFVSWSDGFINATRFDQSIRRNTSVTAYFAEICDPSVILKSLETVPYNYDLTCKFDLLRDEINGIRYPAVDLSDVKRLNLGRTLFAQIKTTLELVLPGMSIEQTSTGQLDVKQGSQVYTALPVKVYKVGLNDVPGVSFTVDGRVKIVTQQGLVLYVNAASVQLTELQRALIPLQVAINQMSAENGDLMLQELLNARAIKAALNLPYYSARSQYLAESVAANAVEGIQMRPYLSNAIANINAAYHFYQDSQAQWHQQVLVPVPADWDNLAKQLAVDGFTQIKLEENGVIHAQYQGKFYRAIMDYRVVPTSVVGDQVRFEDSIGDINGDGITDYRVIYPNGEAQNLRMIGQP